MKYFPLILLVFIFSCKETPSSVVEKPEESVINFQEKKVYEIADVFADNEFDGAKLDNFKQLNDSTFQAIISPENAPINRSPYFAFRLWSKAEKDITLEIKYTEHGQRYIPKLSTDGQNWESISEEDYYIDTLEKKGILKLSLDVEKLWVAAQEVISSEDTYKWMDQFLSLPFAQRKVIGKTVLDKPIYSVEFSENKSKNVLAIIGRQHPPEIPGGTIALKAFVEELLAENDLAKQFRQQFDIQMIPLLNPDGADLGFWRHNANGLDLNRDWQDFSQPETQAARDYFKEQTDKDIKFAIDFHTSYNGPYLLVLDTLNAKKTKNIIPSWIEKIESKLEGQKLDIRPRSQDLPYCYNWFINEFGAEAVTYEEGDELGRAEIRIRGRFYARNLMEVLLGKE